MGRYVLSHAHPAGSNIETCWARGEIGISHTETDVENNCNPKTELASQTDMWQTKNRPIHTENKKDQTNLKYAEKTYNRIFNWMHQTDYSKCQQTKTASRKIETHSPCTKGS